MPNGLQQCLYCLELDNSVNISADETIREFDPNQLDIDSILDDKVDEIVTNTPDEAEILDQNLKLPYMYSFKHTRTEPESIQCSIQARCKRSKR